MDSGPGGEMNIRLNNNCQKRQQRRAYRRVRLGIDRLRIVNAMLLAEFGAIRWRWTGISSHRELQEQQRAQAKPCDIFSARSTHKTMITRSLPNFVETPDTGVTTVFVKCCSSSR